MSPDGRKVYVADGQLGHLAALRRDRLTGALQQPSDWCVTTRANNGCRRLRAIRDIEQIQLSRDGRQLYAIGGLVSSAPTIAVFRASGP
jgi:hypothetical protein